MGFSKLPWLLKTGLRNKTGYVKHESLVATKKLNFCLILINLGFLKAEFTDQTSNVSKFYLSPIQFTQY